MDDPERGKPKKIEHDAKSKCDSRPSHDIIFSEFKQRTRLHQNVLVIGGAGAGKTSLCQHMIHQQYSQMDLHKISSSGFSVTKDITKYESNFYLCKKDNGEYGFTFYDTIGLGADDVNVEEIFKELWEMIKVVKELHKVLIVMKVERNRPKAFEDVQKFMRALYKLGAKTENCFLILTHCELLGPKERADFISEQLQNLNGEIESTKPVVDCELKLSPDNVLCVCLARLDTIPEKLKTQCQDMLVESKHELFDLLKKKTSYFTPLSELVREIETRFDCSLKQLEAQFRSLESKQEISQQLLQALESLLATTTQDLETLRSSLNAVELQLSSVNLLETRLKALESEKSKKEKDLEKLNQSLTKTTQEVDLLKQKPLNFIDTWHSLILCLVGFLSLLSLLISLGCQAKLEKL